MLIFFSGFVVPSLGQPLPGRNCFHCPGDYVHCSGVTSSVCGSPECACAAPTLAFADVLHPGFFAQQVSGKLVITAVLKGSPAEGLGIQKGDEILEINHKEPGNLCGPSAQWSPDGRNMAALTIRHAENISAIQVPLAPLSRALDALWLRNRDGGQIIPAALARLPAETPHIYGAWSYTFGIEAEPGDGALVVRDILTGSPAHQAGLLPGDRIVEVNRVAAGNGNPQVIVAPTRGERATFVAVDSNGVRRSYALTAASLDTVLLYSSQLRDTDPPRRAIASDAVKVPTVTSRF